MTHQCPVCKKDFQYDLGGERKYSPCFPFCSERCKLIDLGAWLDTDYRIAAHRDPNPSSLMGDDVADQVVF